MKTILQGAPINIELKLGVGEEPFTSYDNVIVEIFTSESKRFIYAVHLTKKEYNELVLSNNDMNIDITVSGKNTALMSGNVMAEIKLHKNVGLNTEMQPLWKGELGYNVTNFASKNEY